MGIPEVNILVIDCDGVLTDGTLVIDHTGEKLFKKFHTRDVRAIRELVLNGWEVYIVSADAWGGTAHFAEKVGAVFVNLKDKSDLTFLGSRTIYAAVGDDAWDVKLLKGAKLAFCPADADPSVKKLGKVQVVGCIGGRGVIAHLLPTLLDQPY